MHHSLRIYSRYRKQFLRYYIFQAKWTQFPIIGSWVRWVANKFGGHAHGAYLLTEEDAAAIIDSAGSLALGPCACRTTFKKCDHPLNTEIMVGLGQSVFPSVRKNDHYREIDKAEAKRIVQDCHTRGLIHTIIRCRGDFYAICNCCTCCCVPLRLSKKYGIGKALVRHKDIVGEFRKQQLAHGD